VTINRSGSTYRSAGITAAGYLYPGATNTFSASATNFLDFGSGDSFTFLAISRYWNAMATNRVLIAKTPSTGGPAWALRKLTNELRNIISVSDGTNSTGMLASPALPAGTLESASGVMNRSTQTASIYVNNNTVAVANTSAIGSPSNIHPVRIGAYADGAFFTDMEFVAAAVFRSALTAAQIRQIVNYFANREAVL
jgi:soluble P-type ATPase